MTPSPCSRIFSALLLVAGSLLAVPACSGDDGSGGATPGAPTLDELGPQIIAAICDAQLACLGPLADALGGASDCKTQQTAQFNEASLPTLKADVEAGKATYDGSKASACLAQIRTLGCSLQTTRLLELPSCKGLFVGKTAAGGDCTSDAQCAQDLRCEVGGACPGKCSPRGAEGGACSRDDDCQGGLTCDSIQGSQQCSKPVASGGPCGSTTPVCVAGTLCVGASGNGVTGTCKPFSEIFSAASGAACDITKTQLCQGGQSCQIDKLDATGASFSCASKVASGAACKVAIPEVCPAGEYCDGVDLNAKPPVIDGTCKKIPAEGQPCGKPFQGSGCASGLFCSPEGTCKAPVKNGAACSSDRDCLSGHCQGGACVPEDACNGG
jgi:hypothetical protein